MKILQRGPIVKIPLENTEVGKILTCPNCDSILEYEDVDISIIKNNHESFGLVKCPVCEFDNKINMPINKQQFAREGDFEYHLNWARNRMRACGGDMALKYHSEKFKDSYEFCLEYVKVESRNLAFVPEKYRDYQMCIEAVKSFAEGLSDIYGKNDDSFSETYGENQMTLYLIPEHIRTEKFVLNMLDIFKKYNKRAFGFGYYISYVPAENITKKLCLECVKYGANINDLPSKFIDYDVCKLCIESGGDMYDIESLDIDSDVIDRLLREGYLEKITRTNGKTYMCPVEK